jgi:pyruvate kinase
MHKLPKHKTKIVCTIGPSSRSSSILKRLIQNGLNVARLNFSHGSMEEHKKDILTIRSLAAELERVVLILVDLPGPKIRIGQLSHEPLILKAGQDVILTTKKICGTTSHIPVNYPGLPKSVSAGSLIYLNDGFIQLKVRSTSSSEVKCRVIIGGPLLSHKGLNIPEAKLNMGGITQTDLDYVDFGMRKGIRSFCVSFVRNAEDIRKVKDFARKRGTAINVVAKIERAEAIENIDKIIEAADAIMVARGDLGVQIPIEKIPGVQKSLIRKANLAGCPVITATQMLESMTENIRPTRAEVTDVANAILDGTDAVMLSEETAIGKYPVDAVKMMTKIARSTEHQRDSSGFPFLSEEYIKHIRQKTGSIEDVVSMNVIESMRDLKARLILTPTHSGSTSRSIARFKPESWNLAFCRDERVRDFLTLSYGVYPILIRHKIEDWAETMLSFIGKNQLAVKGDTLIMTQGISGKGDGTNSLRVIKLI